jgi:hypothetical protein
MEAAKTWTPEQAAKDATEKEVGEAMTREQVRSHWAGRGISDFESLTDAEVKNWSQREAIKLAQEDYAAWRFTDAKNKQQAIQVMLQSSQNEHYAARMVRAREDDPELPDLEKLRGQAVDALILGSQCSHFMAQHYAIFPPSYEQYADVVPYILEKNDQDAIRRNGIADDVARYRKAVEQGWSTNIFIYRGVIMMSSARSPKYLEELRKISPVLAAEHDKRRAIILETAAAGRKFEEELRNPQFAREFLENGRTYSGEIIAANSKQVMDDKPYLPPQSITEAEARIESDTKGIVKHLNSLNLSEEEKHLAFVKQIGHSTEYHLRERVKALEMETNMAWFENRESYTAWLENENCKIGDKPYLPPQSITEAEARIESDTKGIVKHLNSLNLSEAEKDLAFMEQVNRSTEYHLRERISVLENECTTWREKEASNLGDRLAVEERDKKSGQNLQVTTPAQSAPGESSQTNLLRAEKGQTYSGEILAADSKQVMQMTARGVVVHERMVLNGKNLDSLLERGQGVSIRYPFEGAGFVRSDLKSPIEHKHKLDIGRYQ